MPVTLINRFDVVIPRQDNPEEIRDTNVGNAVLADGYEESLPEYCIGTDLIRKIYQPR